MTTRVLRFVELSERDRKRASPLPRREEGDTVEMRVRHRGGGQETVALPPGAAALVETALDRLLRGERVALLSEEQEVTPNEAAAILGMSRPLVVHRMDVGDLPFRHVGRHRRIKVADALALQARLDSQQVALDALAAETEALMRDHGL